MDKSTWGPGQWQTEPDLDRWLDPFTGWACELKRHARHGNWLGYVYVPMNLLRKKPSVPDLRNRIELEVSVHGGVTWCERSVETDCMKIGFDASHGGDYSPGIAALMNRISPRYKDRSNETYRNHAYCWLEVFKMTQQIAEIIK